MNNMPRFFLLVAIVGAAGACKDAASQPPAAAPPAAPVVASPPAAPPPIAASTPPASAAAPTAPTAAMPTGPLKLHNKGKVRAFKEGCLVPIGRPFVIMLPERKGAKACDVDGEDDFAMSIEWHPCGEADSCPLPPPGATFSADVWTFDEEHGNATITVLRHEKPYLVVSIVDAKHATPQFAGELRVEVDEAVSVGNPALEASWK